MTLKNNRAPLLSNIKLYASFYHHMWIQTGVTVRKRLSWVVTSVTLTFDLWPWPFAWTLRWSLVITSESFMMIRWWEHSQKGVTDRRTDGQTDGQTENTICRAAWSQLKNIRGHKIKGILWNITKNITRSGQSYNEYICQVWSQTVCIEMCESISKWNKANLRDLITATSQVILIKSDPNPWNRWFFSLCDLEICQMTSQNNREPLPCP